MFSLIKRCLKSRIGKPAYLGYTDFKSIKEHFWSYLNISLGNKSVSILGNPRFNHLPLMSFHASKAFLLFPTICANFVQSSNVIVMKKTYKCSLFKKK